MKARWLIVALAAATALAPGAAHGKWTQLSTGGGQSGTRNIGLARTADGTLHVVWQREPGAVLHTGISASGRAGSPTSIVTGWAGVGDADVAVGANGELLAFWAGSRTTNTSEPLFGLNLATSTNGGSSWSLTPASIFKDNFAHARTPSVAIVNGVPIQTWYSVGEPFVHVGVDPSRPGVLHAPPGSNQEIAASPGGETWIAWCNGLTRSAGLGVWVERIDPATGAAAAPAARVPGSFTPFQGADQHLCPAAARTALVARAGGGFFVATVTGYPTETDLIVWRIGSARPVVVARSRDGLTEEVALAADPNGRIWVGWSDSVGGKPIVYFRRSNRSAGVWGATVAVAAPAGHVDFANMDLAAQATRLDAVARLSNGTSVNLFHTQVSPGLTLVARGGRVVAFRVLDAGDPVAGATIKVGGRTLRTNAAGAASVDLGRGRFRAVASKAGYVSATARVRSS
jgi:hypothetical protein